GNVTETVPPVGVAANNLSAASCPSSYPSGYGDRLASDAATSTFNALGQKTQQTAPAPAGQPGFETTTYGYDGDGHLTSPTAPPATAGGPAEVTVDTYNPAGLLASESTGVSGSTIGSTISYCYDPNGDKTAVVYGNGNTGVSYQNGAVTGLAACGTS